MPLAVGFMGHAPVAVDDGRALKFNSNEITYVRTRSAFQAFQPNTNYLFQVQVKVENLVTMKGKWPDGLNISVYHGPKIYDWIGVTGSGDSDGWMTAVLPFDTGAKATMVRSRIMLIMGHMSGTVWFRNATVETCGEAEFSNGRNFLVGNKKVGVSVLKLR